MAEYNFRKEQLKNTLGNINELNSQNGSATYGVNFMADWTPQENKRLLGYRSDSNLREKEGE